MQGAPREIAQKIEALCKEKHISVNAMLKEIELNKSIIDNMKRDRKPNADAIIKIASYFKVTTDYLLGIEAPGTENGDGRSGKAKYLIDKITRMSDEQVAALEVLVDSIIRERGE